MYQEFVKQIVEYPSHGFFVSLSYRTTCCEVLAVGALSRSTFESWRFISNSEQKKFGLTEFQIKRGGLTSQRYVEQTWSLRINQCFG